jgi:Ni/Fe-hydrogenase 1 B-type cytochrome subunit
MVMSVNLQDAESVETAAGNTVFVYEAPVRVWHWINALSIVVMAITGYLIASPLSSVSGEASDNFLMGYIRFAHFAAGYVFAIGLLARLYWAFVGNRHARQLFILPVTDKQWWAGLLNELRWYLFIEKFPKKYVGHNPLGHLFMFVAITLCGTFMIVTGFALYGEGAQAGSWSHSLFTSWVIPLFGQSQDVHSWHHLIAWGIVCFIIAHVYTAIREEIMSKQTMISTMIDGERTFR